MADFEAVLQAERDAHQQRMQQLRQEEAVLQAVLGEQSLAFTALITRVTNLRVAKGEYLAAHARGEVTKETFATGSPTVDRLLSLAQQKMESASGTGGALLSQLSDAAAEAVTPFYPNSLNFKNEGAVRTTGIAIVTRSDLRSVRAWGKRHLKECPACAQRVARETPRWEKYRYDCKHSGLAAATLSAGAPEKSGYRCALRIVRDRSMRQRAIDGDHRLDVFRATVRLHVTAPGGQPLVDPAAAADSIGTFAAKWSDRSLALVRERVATSGPWNQEGAANPELSAAVAMLLHAMVPAVRVRPVKREDVAAPVRVVHQQNPQKPSFLPLEATALDVTLSLSTPVQISSLAPLLSLLSHPEQRRYLVDHLLVPLATRLGGAFGMSEVVGHYVGVALNTLEAMQRLAQAHGLLGAQAAAPLADPALALRDSVTSKLYSVCLALALFNSTLEVEAGVPTVTAAVEGAAPASVVDSARVRALRLAKAFLRNLRTRSPFTLPVLNDPECADLVLRITDAPTRFLEILNQMFSSNERLPSTSRGSALDLVMTPRAKLSLALKLYSELCVEVYRPFDAQATAGAVLASENGASGRPRAPPCVPVVDLSVDAARANVELSRATEALCQKLDALEGEVWRTTAVEQEGRRMLDSVAEAMGQSEPYQQWKEDLVGIGVEVKLVSRVVADVMLPFGTGFTDPRKSTQHVLYLQVEGSQTF